MADELDNAVPRYGKRKLDEAQYEKQKAAKTLSGRAATKYGARKGNGPAPAATPPAATPRTPQEIAAAAKAAGALSLEQLQAALGRRPEMLDSAIALELKLQRPRRGALRLFLETEAKRKSGARAEVVERLNAALANEAGDPPPTS